MHSIKYVNQILFLWFSRRFTLVQNVLNLKILSRNLDQPDILFKGRLFRCFCFFEKLCGNNIFKEVKLFAFHQLVD